MSQSMSNRQMQTPRSIREMEGVNIPRTRNIINHRKFTSFNCGEVIPIFHCECVPGDTISYNGAIDLRTVEPVRPVQDNINLDIHAFFVEHWTTYDRFEELHGENKTGAWIPSTSIPPYPSFPVSDVIQHERGSILDHLGYDPARPMNEYGGLVSAAAARAFKRIWNEHCRNQNYIAPVPEFTSSDPEPITDYNVRYSVPTDNIGSPNYMASKYGAMRRRDYFSTVLPAPQKSATILAPIDMSLLRVSTATDEQYRFNETPLTFVQPNGGQPTGNLAVNTGETQATGVSTGSGVGIYPSNLVVDPEWELNKLGLNIDKLRKAYQFKIMAEKDNAGTRYPEKIAMHFGLKITDEGNRRPQYIGGYRTVLNITQVEQTSSSTDDQPLGQVGALSHTVDTYKIPPFTAKKHGIYMVIVMARCDRSYTSGLHKDSTIRNYLDYYNPALAHIGYQPVYKYELTTKEGVDKDTIIGYRPVYDYMRSYPDRASGGYRQGHPQDLAIFNYSDESAVLPTNNNWHYDNSRALVDRTLTFDTEIPASTIEALPTYTYIDQVYGVFYFNFTMDRPLPMFGTPKFSDHLL